MKIDKELEKAIRHNFINGFPILFDEIPHKTTRISFEKKVLYNSSIAHYQDGYILSARSSNSNLVREITTPKDFNYNGLININYLFYFDKDDVLISHKIIDDSSIENISNSKYHGIEDIRLFAFQETIYGVATQVSIKDNLGHPGYTARTVSFEMNDNLITNPVIWDSPFNKKADKNWTPIVKDGILYFAYNLNPLLLLRVDGKNAVVASSEALVDQDVTLCGGTPFVNIGNQYISVAHYPRFTIDKCYYRHCFIVMDSDFEIIEISEPFFIQRRGIEFACGLIVENDDLILSYGVADRAAFYTRFQINSLRKYLISI